jgi:hypothetical protein
LVFGAQERKDAKGRYQFSNFQKIVRRGATQHNSKMEREDEDIYSRNNQFANAINEGNKC